MIKVPPLHSPLASHSLTFPVHIATRQTCITFSEMRLAWLPGSRPAQFPQPSQNNYSRSPAHLANHPGWLSASCTFPLTSQVCYLPLLKDSRLLLHGRQAGIRVCWICNSVHEPKHAAGQRASADANCWAAAPAPSYSQQQQRYGNHATVSLHAKLCVRPQEAQTDVWG